MHGLVGFVRVSPRQTVRGIGDLDHPQVRVEFGQPACRGVDRQDAICQQSVDGHDGPAGAAICVVELNVAAFFGSDD